MCGVVAQTARENMHAILANIRRLKEVAAGQM